MPPRRRSHIALTRTRRRLPNESNYYQRTECWANARYCSSFVFFVRSSSSISLLEIISAFFSIWKRISSSRWPQRLTPAPLCHPRLLFYLFSFDTLYRWSESPPHVKPTSRKWKAFFQNQLCSMEIYLGGWWRFERQPPPLIMQESWSGA